MKGRSKKSLLLATLVLVSISLWYIYNLDQGAGRYEWHRKLWFEENRTYIKPLDLLTNYSHSVNAYEHYVNGTNAIGRLYDAIRIVNIISALPNEQAYRNRESAQEAGKPVANITSCGRQLSLIKQALQETPAFFELRGQVGLELTNFMDTFGRPGSGFFSRGADFWEGSYEHCVKATISKLGNGMTNQDDFIKGHYCMGRFRFNKWPEGPTLNDPEPAIKLGLCLPEVCDSNSIESFNETIEYLAKQQLPKIIGRQIGLESLFCLPHEKSSLRHMSLNSRIFLYLGAIWISLILVISTCYEFSLRKIAKRRQQQKHLNHLEKQKSLNSASSSKDIEKSVPNETVEYNQKSPLMKLLIGFTLRNSINSFTIWRKPQEGARVILTSLDFVKLMMAFAIVISHSLIFSIYKTRTRISYYDLGRSDLSKFILSFGRCVDTFLTLFGLTMSYILLQRFDIRKLGNPFIWISANLAIFLRIMPLHALIVLFNKWITPHIGSGPWWDYGVDYHSSRYECAVAPWYHVIPGLGNLGKYPGPPCNPPAWFLGPYSQIALFIPFLTYLIGILPTHTIRALFVASCSLISAANVASRLYYQSVVTSESIADYGGFAVAVVERFESSGYMETLGRFGSVLIGSYSGYLLHLYQVGEIADWPRWFKSKLFQLCIILVHIALFLLPLVGNKKPESIEEAQKAQITMFQFALINFLMIPVWPIINCILIIAAVTVFKTHVVVRFMSHPLWSAANKLGLGIYLIHFEVLMTSLTFYEHAISNGNAFEVFRLGAFACTVTIMLAIFLYLFYEAPLAYIVRKFVLPAIRRATSGGSANKLRTSIDAKLQPNDGNKSLAINMVSENPNLIIPRASSRSSVQFISDNYVKNGKPSVDASQEDNRAAAVAAAKEINQFLQSHSDKNRGADSAERPLNGLLAKLKISSKQAEAADFQELKGQQNGEDQIKIFPNETSNGKV